MKRSIAWLCALHLFGNALILWLGYYWLGIGESDASHLAWSALVVLVFLCSGLWLHGTALALFEHETTLNLAATSALRNLLPLSVIGIAAVMFYGVLAYWHDSFAHTAFVIASYTTMKLRRPVPPANVLRAFHGFIWVLRWLVVPMLLLPLAAAVANVGWHGFRARSLRRCTNLLYWLEVCALLLLAIWVPLKLLSWIPQFSSFWMQFSSFLGRLALGYLLFVSGLLSLEFLTSAGKPRFIQASTLSSP